MTDDIHLSDGEETNIVICDVQERLTVCFFADIVYRSYHGKSTHVGVLSNLSWTVQ